MKFREDEYWWLLLLGVAEAIATTLVILSLSALTSCNRKTIERITHDTLTIVRTDTLWHTDTLRQIVTIKEHDSTAMERNVLQVVDTTGKVIKEYIYQDRIVYRDRVSKDSTKNVSSTAKSSEDKVTKVAEATTKEKKSKGKGWTNFIFVGIAALISGLLYDKVLKKFFSK